jgi:putative membrane protein
MHTKIKYTHLEMIKWTSHDIIKFMVMALIPVILYEAFDLKWLHLPWLPIALIGTAVAFVVGFQNNAAYGRIWEARKIWGGIVNASRSWGIIVSDFITNDFAEINASEEEIKQIKKELIYRHIAWMTSLRHAMRAPKPWEHFLKYKTNKKWSENAGIREFKFTVEEELEPYLSKKDFDYVLSKTNKATHTISLQSRQLKELKKRGLIDDFRHMEMENMLIELYNLQGKSERIKNFPYPRQFATLNHNFVWIFLLLLPFGIMNEFDTIGITLVEDYPFIGANFVWLTIPFSVIVSWVFHTMERIGRTGENPFEGTANDVPITTMSRGIEIDLREMLDEPPETIPKPVKAKFNMEM